MNNNDLLKRLQLLDPEIQKNVLGAMQDGAPPDVAISAGERKVQAASNATQVQQTATTQPQAAPAKSILQGNLQSDNLFSGGGAISNILNAVAQPFTRTGRMIGGAVSAAVQAPGLADSTNTVNANTDAQIALMKKIKGEKDPTKVQALLDQAKALSNKGSQARDRNTQVTSNSQNPFLSQGEQQEASQSPLSFIGKQAATSAQLPLYAMGGGVGKAAAGDAIVPGVSKIAQLLGSNSLKARLAVGAGGGAVSSIANGGDTEDVVKSAILGGGLNTILPGIANKVKGLGRAEQLAGRGIADDVSQLHFDPSLGGAAAEKRAQGTLRDLGVTGTPQQRYEKLAPAVQHVEDNIQAAIGESDPFVKVSDVATQLKKNAAGATLTGTSSRVLNKKINGFLTNLYDMSFQGQNGSLGEKVSLSQLLDMKRALNSSKEVESIFNQQAMGGKLSPEEKIVLGAWDAIDNAVTDASPEVKKLLLQQSDIYKSVKSIDSARSRQSQLSLMGNQAPRQVGQATQNALGAGVEKVGGATSKLGTILQAGIGPEASRLATPIAQNYSRSNAQAAREQYQQDIKDPEIQKYLSSPTTGAQDVLSQSESKESITQDMVSRAHLELSKGEAEKIQAAYDNQASSKLTAAQKNNITQIKSGLNILDTLEDSYKGLARKGLIAKGQDFGLLQGVLGQSGAARQSSPEAAAYDATRDAFLATLARATGEKGTLTDQDVNRIKKAIPGFYTPPATAMRQWANLRSIIAASIIDPSKAIDTTSLGQ